MKMSDLRSKLKRLKPYAGVAAGVLFVVGLIVAVLTGVSEGAWQSELPGGFGSIWFGLSGLGVFLLLVAGATAGVLVLLTPWNVERVIILLVSSVVLCHFVGALFNSAFLYMAAGVSIRAYYVAWCISTNVIVFAGAVLPAPLLAYLIRRRC